MLVPIPLILTDREQEHSFIGKILNFSLQVPHRYLRNEHDIQQYPIMNHLIECQLMNFLHQYCSTLFKIHFLVCGPIKPASSISTQTKRKINIYMLADHRQWYKTCKYNLQQWATKPWQRIQKKWRACAAYKTLDLDQKNELQIEPIMLKLTPDSKISSTFSMKMRNMVKIIPLLPTWLSQWKYRIWFKITPSVAKLIVTSST